MSAMVLVQKRAAVSVAAAALLACGMPVHAAPIIQPDNWAYIFDDFSSVETSATNWGYQSCDRVRVHKETVEGIEKFPLFGTAARKGYCGFRCDGAFTNDPKGSRADQLCVKPADDNRYLQFVTQPFDRRTAVVKFNADGSIEDNWGTPTEIDDGKGGSETRANTGEKARYDGDTKTHGWDLWGENYLVETNTVRYSWKFRLSDISMLQPYGGERMASKAAVGQFHIRSGTSSPSGKSCSEIKSFSPSPGLYVSDNGASVLFRLTTKLKNSQIPAGLTQCQGLPGDECEVELWKQEFPTAQVTRINSSDTHTPPWISVSFIMRPSLTNGALRFYFGVDGSTDIQLRYQSRLLGKDHQWTTAHLPMTQNECPTQPYLGAYVLGYNRKYYGYLQNDAGDPKRAEQQPSPSNWVHDNLFYNPALNKFRTGEWLAGETPPQFIVDYDDFRIVQVPQLP